MRLGVLKQASGCMQKAIVEYQDLIPGSHTPCGSRDHCHATLLPGRKSESLPNRCIDGGVIIASARTDSCSQLPDVWDPSPCVSDESTHQAQGANKGAPWVPSF